MRAICDWRAGLVGVDTGATGAWNWRTGGYVAWPCGVVRMYGIWVGRGCSSFTVAAVSGGGFEQAWRRLCGCPRRPCPPPAGSAR
jgi:hypothetical protein